jgi:predicted transcriptional regulator
MPSPASDPELKTEFSTRIKELLSKSTAQEIATALQVKRQMIYNYRDGRNAPSPEVIRRAMETWHEFSLSYRGKT